MNQWLLHNENNNKIILKLNYNYIKAIIIIIIRAYMLSRLVIKRFCHTHTRSKCYENIHKIESMKLDIHELKESIKDLREPIGVMYVTNLASFVCSFSLLLQKFNS